MLDKSEIPVKPVMLRNSVCLIVVSIKRHACADFSTREQTRRTREATSSANYPVGRGPRFSDAVSSPWRKLRRKEEENEALTGLQRIGLCRSARITLSGSNKRRSLARISSLATSRLDARGRHRALPYVIAACFPYFANTPSDKYSALHCHARGNEFWHVHLAKLADHPRVESWIEMAGLNFSSSSRAIILRGRRGLVVRERAWSFNRQTVDYSDPGVLK